MVIFLKIFFYKRKFFVNKFRLGVWDLGIFLFFSCIYILEEEVCNKNIKFLIISIRSMILLWGRFFRLGFLECSF